MNNQERVRAARAAYAREYRKKHPERIKAAQERYWLKRLEHESGDTETRGETNHEQAAR